MKTITAYCSIEDGKLVLRNPELFSAQIAETKDTESCLLTIQGGDKRSNQQNAYLFGGICKTVAERLNQDGWQYESYDIYKWIENKWCKIDMLNTKTGEIKPKTARLRYLPADMFSGVIDAARRYFMDATGIYIQTPAEFYGMSEQNYDLWKLGQLTYAEAKSKL